jgi:hypothetical protein
MTQEELSQWHARLREHRNFQTMMAHTASVGVAKEKKTTVKPPKDMSDFV